jgi:glycosyltransferase involved in cell wall biosynthesis
MVRAAGILVSSYRSGATEGRNLGSAGYSYDFVARQFLPLLQRMGEVAVVEASERSLKREADRLQQQGLTPVHICFKPFQHAHLSGSVSNVVVPAWEFPDVPDHAFDGDERNDWVAQANRCAALIVGGEWTAAVFRRAGITCPIHVVPVPTSEDYFTIPRWKGNRHLTIDIAALEFGPAVIPLAEARAPGALSTQCRQSRGQAFARAARSGYKALLRRILPARLDACLTAGLHAAARAWRQPAAGSSWSPSLDLAGVVYTSIFNPDDGRKNWDDLISAFLTALGDCSDATLVLKLIGRSPAIANDLVSHYQRLDLEHRCRLILVTGFLSPAQMRELTCATTYYITSTRAEGNCLPLMDHLAAGRPAVSPCHTAISDYFGSEVGFVVESHPEPAAWPQDARLRYRTTWHRLVWSSLVDQIRRSYEVARHRPAAYEKLSAQARQTMLRRSHPEAVACRLRFALEQIVSTARTNTVQSPVADQGSNARFKAA